ncbi:DUF397 domain-containing protein [Streptomyces sp. NPDC014676]|uniref:DUF397 domain-containing protein n=1 Tax=Streptomyces sp. NPDC014676 TaxID=3364879 RepID=UPI0036F90C45
MTANTNGGGTDPVGTSLYGRELVGPYDYMCNTDGSNTDMESCLGIAGLKGGGYSITGTKPEDSGRELRGTVGELRAFYRTLRGIPEIAGNPTL